VGWPKAESLHPTAVKVKYRRSDWQCASARGHVDCVEIIKGKDARASAIPRLIVVDDRAKLTREAAIGSVDKKQVETLMARGLSEDEAVDVVVRGMLR